MPKLEDQIISTLKGTGAGLTLSELSQSLGESEKKVYKALRKLFQKDVVDSHNRRYTLANR